MLNGGRFSGQFVGQLTNLNALKLGDVTKVVPVTASWPLLAMIAAFILLRRTGHRQKNQSGCPGCKRRHFELKFRLSLKFVCFVLSAIACANNSNGALFF